MRELFVTRNFHSATQALIDHANAIIAEYTEDGFRLTLRQLYYQFVARKIIPNTMRSYHRLGKIVNDARLAGLIDWSAIEDRTRNLAGTPHWNDPNHAVEELSEQYRLDKWEGQDFRVECWIEKEALVGILERVCRDSDVDWFACRGYVSQSEQYVAGKRFDFYRRVKNQQVVILHLGDHDPSGIDMTRDNDDRLEMFTRRQDGVHFHRIALNMDQVEQYDPPPNPAKITDTRYAGYVRKHGDESWELDALNPIVLQKLISDKIADYLDREKFDAIAAQESEQRAELVSASKEWRAVQGFLDTHGKYQG